MQGDFARWVKAEAENAVVSGATVRAHKPGHDYIARFKELSNKAMGNIVPEGAEWFTLGVGNPLRMAMETLAYTTSGAAVPGKRGRLTCGELPRAVLDALRFSTPPPPLAVVQGDPAGAGAAADGVTTTADPTGPALSESSDEDEGEEDARRAKVPRRATSVISLGSSDSSAAEDDGSSSVTMSPAMGCDQEPADEEATEDDCEHDRRGNKRVAVRDAPRANTSAGGSAADGGEEEPARDEDAFVYDAHRAEAERVRAERDALARELQELQAALCEAKQRAEDAEVVATDQTALAERMCAEQEASGLEAAQAAARAAQMEIARDEAIAEATAAQGRLEQAELERDAAGRAAQQRVATAVDQVKAATDEAERLRSRADAAEAAQAHAETSASRLKEAYQEAQRVARRAAAGQHAAERHLQSAQLEATEAAKRIICAEAIRSTREELHHADAAEAMAAAARMALFGGAEALGRTLSLVLGPQLTADLEERVSRIRTQYQALAAGALQHVDPEDVPTWLKLGVRSAGWRLGNRWDDTVARADRACRGPKAAAMLSELCQLLRQHAEKGAKKDVAWTGIMWAAYYRMCT